MFSWYQAYSDAEQATRDGIREVVKDIDAVAREIERTLQQCHHLARDQLPAATGEARALFARTKDLFAQLATTYPVEEYYRYNGHWRNVVQQLAYLGSLLVYLENESLLTLEDFQALLGATPRMEKGFYVDMEDYLYGVCSLPSELARLATNCVTMGDLERPLRINNFVNELHNGFRLLNLKNDNLRKKFDSLKYDVRKIEGVIYDLSIRGLLPGAGAKAVTGADSAASAADASNTH